MTIVSGAPMINMITLVIDDSIGIHHDLKSSITMVEEWHLNLEHQSLGVIYDRNILIVQATGFSKMF